MDDPYLNEILEELQERDPECVKCHALTVTLAQWNFATADERCELREDGYVDPGSRGLCQKCYRALCRIGGLEAYPKQPTGLAQGARKNKLRAA